MTESPVISNAFLPKFMVFPCFIYGLFLLSLIFFFGEIILSACKPTIVGMQSDHCRLISRPLSACKPTT